MAIKYAFLIGILISINLHPLLVGADTRYEGDNGVLYIDQYRLDQTDQSHLIISNYNEVIITNVATDKTFEFREVNQLVIQQSSFDIITGTGFEFDAVSSLKVLSNTISISNGTLFKLHSITNFEFTQNSIYAHSTPFVIEQSTGMLNFNYFNIDFSSSILQSLDSSTTSYQNWISIDESSKELVILRNSSHQSIYDRVLSGTLNVTVKDISYERKEFGFVDIIATNHNSIRLQMEYVLPSLLVDIMGKHQSEVRLYDDNHLLKRQKINRTKVGERSVYPLLLDGNFADIQQSIDIQIYLKSLFETSYWFNDTMRLLYKRDAMRTTDIRNDLFGLGSYRCPEQLPQDLCDVNLKPNESTTKSLEGTETVNDLTIIKDFMESPYAVVMGFVVLIMIISKSGQYLHKKQ